MQCDRRTTDRNDSINLGAGAAEGENLYESVAQLGIKYVYMRNSPVAQPY
jgi:hypothetical protein